MIEKLRIAMLISGGGTTMDSIIKACKSGHLPKVDPILVISSRPNAGGIQKAIAAGIPTKDVLVIAKKDYPPPGDFGEAILEACRARRVNLIGQYGWMVKTPLSVIDAYQNMMVNQHPGPLDPGRPDFGGKGMFGRRVHCAVLYFARTVNRDFLFTEATAQRVAVEYDKGVVLRTKEVPISKSNDVISLQEKVLPEEHRVQIETLKDFSEGTVFEITRETPLVLPEEVSILEQAKEIAEKLFPKG